ncbi:sugar isomerase domain-containing protein [Nocardioides panzhihuensis]|uniref:Putative phosphosugar-binding protein n=1 Tax=Nocardioides panzhihuensis TaxID=860243 RepID=A0A7Z0DH80_9ACTN|nr:SIS domain-containing protein [Nocardioides panzhihuensis]NYI75458.1 putative phosphosugar-binding protein [Nocardioides panzhihuensis]
MITDVFGSFDEQVRTRLSELQAIAQSGGFDEAVELMVSSIRNGGVLQAFGTGHSQAFAMEIAGRAGGLIPTHAIALRDTVLMGERPASDLAGGLLERDSNIANELWELHEFHSEDVFLIASNSGVNGSIVGIALRAKEEGHKVIAVTSLEHTNAVTPKHPSGKRLAEIADVVIDNLAPFGDATVPMGASGAEGLDDPDGQGVMGGAVSSITAAYIAQLLTIGTAATLQAAGETPPLYLSANIPGGDEHNDALKARYGERIGSMA